MSDHQMETIPMLDSQAVFSACAGGGKAETLQAAFLKRLRSYPSARVVMAKAPINKLQALLRRSV
jgi:hypothetical protein